MQQHTDILLDDNNDMKVQAGDFATGLSVMQEVGLLMPLNPGELKEHPTVGPALLRMINGKASQAKIQSTVTQQLANDGKNYDEIKSMLTVKAITH